LALKDICYVCEACRCRVADSHQVSVDNTVTRSRRSCRG